MNPQAIPVAIEYVIGIMITVKKAGTAISNFCQSIFLSDDAINTPTITNAGAVTADVTTDRSGKKNRDRTNSNPVTTAAKPLRAPAATPDVDST
jgi:hypothetical protein